jgi:hypothetical protein
MNEEELVSKLRQIEEQARLTLEEFPKTLTRERQRMIIALAKYIRAGVEDRTPTPGEAFPRHFPGSDASHEH